MINAENSGIVDQVFKAYDIRGLVEKELTPDFTFKVGCAFANFLLLKNEPKNIVVGEDMRPSSKPLADAFSDGIISQGADVTRIGLASTDMLYFASGYLKLPGAMFTASHNPANYNGIKLCFSGARPIGKESGLVDIAQQVIKESQNNSKIGNIFSQNLLEKYVDFLVSLVPALPKKENLDTRRLKIVVDAGNGMAGYTLPALFDKLPFDLIPLYFELDGNFPNHEANPIDPKNLVDLQKAVLSNQADLGLAFDGDADRCFLVDEKGNLISPSSLTALIAKSELEKNPGATIIYNLISSKIVPEIIEQYGGVALRSRVGHSYIKALMASNNAVFGGEHSGHFYFRDFFRADSGALAALYAIAELANSQYSMSEIVKPYAKYFSSGEINIEINPKVSIDNYLEKIAEVFEAGAELDRLDGLTVLLPQGWFNLRPSNTEPLLRLNIESANAQSVKELQAEVEKVITLMSR